MARTRHSTLESSLLLIIIVSSFFHFNAKRAFFVSFCFLSFCSVSFLVLISCPLCDSSVRTSFFLSWRMTSSLTCHHHWAARMPLSFPGQMYSRTCLYAYFNGQAPGKSETNNQIPDFVGYQHHDHNWRTLSPRSVSEQNPTQFLFAFFSLIRVCNCLSLWATLFERIQF